MVPIHSNHQFMNFYHLWSKNVDFWPPSPPPSPIPNTSTIHVLQLIFFINLEFRMQYFQYLKNKFICCRNSLLLILFLEFFRISWNFLKTVVSFLEKIFFSWIWIKINTGDQGVDRKHLLLMHFPLTIQKNSQPVLRCYPFGSCSYTDS